MVEFSIHWYAGRELPFT